MSNIDSDSDTPLDGNGVPPLPNLKSIWDCSNMNKAVVTGVDGVPIAGWRCSWCPGGGRFFRGDNATKALAHIAKIEGKNIQFCKGNIPQNKIIQYRNLWMVKSNSKLDRSARSAALEDGINDMQSRTLQSMFGVVDSSDSHNQGGGDNDVIVLDPAPVQKRAHTDIVVPSGGRQAPSPLAPAPLVPPRRRWQGQSVVVGR